MTIQNENRYKERKRELLGIRGRTGFGARRTDVIAAHFDVNVNAGLVINEKSRENRQNERTQS